MCLVEDIKKVDQRDLEVKFEPVIKQSFANNTVASMLRFLPNIRGVWLLYRLCFSLIPRSARKATLEVSGNGKVSVRVDFDLLDPPQFSMVNKARYDLGSALTIWSLLREGDNFFDVGANSGYLSAVASQKVGDTGLVVSIEPNREAFNFLLERGLSNNIPLNYVVSDVGGESFRLEKKFYRQTTSSYFVEGEGVRSITLDEVYNKLNKPSVRLVKVDAEGAELRIMKGAGQLLKEEGPYVIIEIDEEYLKRYNYDLKGFEEFMKEMGYAHYYFLDNTDASIRSIESIKDGEILFSVKALTPEVFGMNNVLPCVKRQL